MENTNYLADWMIGNLSNEELAQIEGSEALEVYLKIKRVSSNPMDVPKSLEWSHFVKKLPPKKVTKTIKLSWVYSIAASFVLLIGISGFLLSQKEYHAVSTFAQVDLSDGSTAKLSPGATLSHRRNFGWTNRKLSMTGEVFYNVKKGSPFVVTAKNGIVEVLGTAFRVIDTEEFFEVLCTEGKVKVTHQGKSYLLTKGRSFNTIDLNVKEFELSQYETTASVYYSKVPLNYVIGLVENLYDLNIELRSNKSFYFTGLLPLNNKGKAIQSISLPFSFQVKEVENGNLTLTEE